MSQVNGKDIGIYFAATGQTPVLIAAATSGELSLSTDSIETSNKDTAGFKTFIPGRKSGSISMEAMFIPTDSAISYDDIFDLWKNDTVLDVEYKHAGTGNKTYSAQGVITSLGQSAPDGEVVTFSAEIQLSGAISRSVNA